MKYASVFVLVLLAVFLLSSCGNLIIAGPQRITFALVIDDLTLSGMVVEADVHDHDEDGEMLETVGGTFTSIEGTVTALWARMTTLEDLPTNQRYHLDFWIDINADGFENAGDRIGVQTFEVMPDAVWSEAKVFAVDLFTVE